MIKSFFSQFWTDIKRSPLIEILIFIQIVLTAYCFFNLLWSLSDLEVQNFQIQAIYGEKDIFCTFQNTDTPLSEYLRAGGSRFGAEGYSCSDYEAYYNRICELTGESDEIDTAIFLRTPVYLHNEMLPGIPVSDSTVGYYSFYSVGNGDSRPGISDSEYWQVNSFSVDKNYIDTYGLTLASGRLFTDEEYEDFNFDRIPVILGASYKGVYKLGDTFHASIFPSEEMMTYEVIGFLTDKHVFLAPGEGSDIYLFDTYMILPYVNKTYDEWMEWLYEPSNLQYRPPVKGMTGSYFHARFGLTNGARVFIVDKGNEDAAVETVNTALAEAGLDTYFHLQVPVKTARQTADQMLEKTTVFAILVSVMTMFSLLGIVFSAINKTSANLRSYAIQTLIGASPANNYLFSVLETFVYCVLGFIAGFFMMYSRIVSWDYQQHPATAIWIERGIIISSVFIAVACALTFFFVRLKMRKYSVAELIRSREVKKNSGAPLYRTITFVMFILASVAVTFLTSYIWSTDNTDKYQYNYLKNGERYIVLMSLLTDDPPIIEPEYKYEDLDDYSMDLAVRQFYEPEKMPKIRAWYSKNGYNIPEVTQGRFFTEEEMSEAVNYVVVGKNVLEDFTEEKNGKRYFTYLNTDYEVIGIVGREGHDTSMDDWAIFSMETHIYRYGGGNAPIYIDAKSEDTVDSIITCLIENSEGNYRYEQGQFYPQVDIGVERTVMIYFIALILISFVVFCVYYIDRILHIMNVKKVIGYSKLMIFTDTAAQFIALSVSAYVLGNGIMLLLAKTVLSNIALFSSFSINLPVLAFSFGILLAIAFLFSVLAVYRSFAGTARDLKRG